jgi:hypothetical protein
VQGPRAVVESILSDMMKNLKADRDVFFSCRSTPDSQPKTSPDNLNGMALNHPPPPAVVRSGLPNRGARFDDSSRGRIASCAFSLLGFGVFSNEKADVTVVSSEFEDLQYAAFGGNPNGSQAVLRIGGNTVKGREWYAVLKPAAVEVLEQVHIQTQYPAP